jgi:phospholipase/carboxylesterase
MLHSELIPAAEPGSKHLLIMLHGLGDSIEGYRWFPEAMRLPWLNYLLVNAPDEYYGGYSWFDFQGNMLPGVYRSRKLLAELLDAQRAQGFPTEQTTLGGFSQGCLMAMDAGFYYPHRFAGLVGISGWMSELEKALQELSPSAKQQRFLVTHGTHDPVVAFERTGSNCRAATIPARAAPELFPPAPPPSLRTSPAKAVAPLHAALRVASATSSTFGMPIMELSRRDRDFGCQVEHITSAFVKPPLDRFEPHNYPQHREPD